MFLADDRVVMQSDCNVWFLDTSGYVTAGNSRLVSGYLFCRKKRQPSSGHEKCNNVYIENYIHHCICNVSVLITYNF